MQEIDVFRLDSQGRMSDQTVLRHPWPVVTLLRDRAMAGQLPFLTASAAVVPGHDDQDDRPAESWSPHSRSQRRIPAARYACSPVSRRNR